jgi:hypothetical protein
VSAARRSRKRPARRTARAAAPMRLTAPKGITVLEADDLDALRRELERGFPDRRPARWNASPEEAQRALAKLVLTLVEFLRKLMERQAIRRMEHRTLTPAQVENVGLALMRLEETIGRIGAHFDLSPEDLQLDLGPLGRLM